MDRRTFLKHTSTASLLSLPGGALVGATTAGPDPARKTFDAHQWQTLEKVQDHLLPSEPGAPGASDINATYYLDRTLADPKFDPEVKGFILKGIGWLDELAEDDEGKPFKDVDPAWREDLLIRISQSSAGKNWLSTLITYTLEALLADPLYGGNPDGIGWTWLEHDPGQPRPTAEKIYGKL
jgi:gluconate 2-dehydrogenase gamma chain